MEQNMNKKNLTPYETKMAHAATILGYEKAQRHMALQDKETEELLREFLREHNVIGTYRDPYTGFDAVLFSHRRTHQSFPVSVGTEELRDVAADIHVGVRQIETEKAKEFYEALKEHSLKYDVQPIFAGHSLGLANAYSNALNYAYDTRMPVSVYTPSGLGALSTVNEFYETSPNAPQLSPEIKALVHTTMVYGEDDPVPTFGKQPENLTAYVIPSDKLKLDTGIFMVDLPNAINRTMSGLVEQHPLASTTNALMDVGFDLSKLEQKRPTENKAVTWAVENVGTYFDSYPEVIEYSKALKKARKTMNYAYDPKFAYGGAFSTNPNIHENPKQTPTSQAPAPVSQPQSFGQRYGLSPKLSTEDIVSMLETKLSKPSLLSEPVAKATTTAAAATDTDTTAPTSDVITAEDGHLIGFAERHGLGWRDVWELNKETIPNPNAVQAGTTLNLPSKRSAYKAPDANAFMSTQAAAKRRVQTQPRFNAGGLYSDYLSPRSQPAAKRTASRKANTAGFNMDLLSTSVNKAARGNYGVTLGGWSPVGGSPAAVQKTAPKPKSDPDLMAVDKRTAQQLAKAVRTEQAAARNAGSLMDNVHSNRASAKEDTLDDIDIGVDTALNARAAKVDKLGESITTWGGERRVGGTPVQTSEDDAISKATAKRERAVNDPNTKPIGWVNDRGEKINDPRTPLDIATAQISQGQGAWGRSTGYNDFQTLASSLTRSGQHGDVGVSDLTSHGTIRGSQQSNMLAEQDKGLFGDSDSGGGNSRVICTELVRQGLMAPSLQRLDIAYTLRHLSPATVRGYHAWAVPYVQLMKRSNLATRLVEPLARWRAEEIAFRMKSRSRPHYRGRAVRWLGEPVCWVLGTVLGWVGDPNRFQPWTEPQQ